jgi:hypothetical protein
VDVEGRSVLDVGALDVNGSVLPLLPALRPTFPEDYWTYEASDLEIIFADFEFEVMERDVWTPGVFLKARKRQDFVLREPDSDALFSIIAGRRALEVTDNEIAGFRRRGKWQRVIRAPERFVRRRSRFMPS